MWGMGEAAGRWGACGGGDKEPKEQETVQEALFKNLPNSHLTWSIKKKKINNPEGLLFLNGLTSHSIPPASGPLHMLICLPASSPSSPIIELMPHTTYILPRKGRIGCPLTPQPETLCDKPLQTGAAQCWNSPAAGMLVLNNNHHVPKGKPDASRKLDTSGRASPKPPGTSGCYTDMWWNRSWRWGPVSQAWCQTGQAVNVFCVAHRTSVATLRSRPWVTRFQSPYITPLALSPLLWLGGPKEAPSPLQLEGSLWVTSCSGLSAIGSRNLVLAPPEGALGRG